MEALIVVAAVIVIIAYSLKDQKVNKEVEENKNSFEAWLDSENEEAENAKEDE